MRYLWLLCCCAGVFGVSAEPARIDIGEFSKGVLAGWHAKAFVGLTDYRLELIDGRTVLKAVSEAAASGLYREMSVDLDRTPYLNWSWRIDQTLGALNEQSKAGDDYPARLYVIVSSGLAFWRSRSINYVWASVTAQGRRWANAYAGDAVQMIALRSGERETGRWIGERRNVKQDLQDCFGEAIHRIDALAVMTDTDNSERRAVAYYGDIYFSDR